MDIVCTDRRAGLGVGVGMGVMERGVTVVPELSSVMSEVCTLGVALVSICWYSASASGCANVCFLHRGGGWRECECECECGWDSAGDRGAVVDGEGAHRSSSLTILRSQAGIPLMLAQHMLEVPPTLLDMLPLFILPFGRCTLDPSGPDDATLGTGESERRIGELLLLVPTPTPLVIPIKLLPTVPKLSSAYSLSRSCPCPLRDKDGDRDRGVNMPLMVLVVDVEDLAECVWESMAGEMLPERLDWRWMEGVGEEEPEFWLELCALRLWLWDFLVDLILDARMKGSVGADGLGVEDLVCGWERMPSSDREALIGDVGGDRGGEPAKTGGGDDEVWGDEAVGDVAEDNDAWSRMESMTSMSPRGSCPLRWGDAVRPARMDLWPRTIAFMAPIHLCLSLGSCISKCQIISPCSIATTEPFDLPPLALAPFLLSRLLRVLVRVEFIPGPDCSVT